LFHINYDLFSKPLNKLVDNTCQKNGYGQCIDEMHDFYINIIWPVGVFFPKEVHDTNLAKKVYTEN